MRFRCHTGHAYSVESLLAEMSEAVEETLWSSIRSLEENVLLLRHIAEHMREGKNGDGAEQFLKRAEDAQRQAALVRQAVMEHKALSKQKVMEVSET